jgi:hypothetical protein
MSDIQGVHEWKAAALKATGTSVPLTVEHAAVVLHQRYRRAMRKAQDELAAVTEDRDNLQRQIDEAIARHFAPAAVDPQPLADTGAAA